MNDITFITNDKRKQISFDDAKQVLATKEDIANLRGELKKDMQIQKTTWLNG